MGEPNASMEVDPALRIALQHEHAQPLAAFVSEMLMQRASGRGLWAGERVVQKRARKAGVSHEMAETMLGNVLKLLAKGANTDDEWALLAALFARGVELSLSESTEDEPDPRTARAVDGIVWLEVNTPCRLGHYLPRVLSPQRLSSLVQLLVEQVRAADQLSATGAVKERAFNATRLLLLSQLAPEPSWVRKLLAELDDPFTRAAAQVLTEDTASAHALTKDASEVETPSNNALPAEDSAARTSLATAPQPEERPTPAVDSAATQPIDDASPAAAAQHPSVPQRVPPSGQADLAHRDTPIVEVCGHLGPVPAGPVGTVLRVLSGWSLVAPIMHAFGLLFGLRKPVTLSLDRDKLRVRKEARAFGVCYRREEQVFLPAALRSQQVAVRTPLVGYLSGLLGLCAAAFLGGALATDALRLLRHDLLVVGLAVLALGAGFDLLIAAGAYLFPRRVGLVLAFDQTRICVTGADLEAAERLVTRLEAHVEGKPTRRSQAEGRASAASARSEDEKAAANVV